MQMGFQRPLDMRFFEGEWLCVGLGLSDGAGVGVDEGAGVDSEKKLTGTGDGLNECEAEKTGLAIGLHSPQPKVVVGSPATFM
jgi:hypothetical protein